MKKRRFSKQKKSNYGYIIKNNQKTIILIILFIIGISLGSFLVKNANAESLIKIKELTESYINLRNSQSILKNFSSLLLTDTIFILFSIVFGLCLLGKPIIWILPVIRGIGIGLISGYIYNIYSVKGLAFCSLFLFLNNTISVLALIISCKESLLTVNELQSYVSGNKEMKASNFYKMYFLRNAILYAVVLFSDALGSVLVCFPNTNTNLLS